MNKIFFVVVTDWGLMWTFPSTKYCGGGDYYLFFCVVEPYKHDYIYRPICISSTVSSLYFLPTIQR
jgi:hypothetical protein